MSSSGSRLDRALGGDADGDPPLTPAVSEYAACVGEFLEARSLSLQLAERRRMGVLLNYALAERGLPLPDDTRWRDSLAGRRGLADL